MPVISLSQLADAVSVIANMAAAQRPKRTIVDHLFHQRTECASGEVLHRDSCHFSFHRYLSFNCPARLSGSADTAAAEGSSVWLLNIVFTVKATLAGGAAYSGVLFIGANPTYTNANNLVLTSDSSTGINIAKQFVAQVPLTQKLTIM